MSKQRVNFLKQPIIYGFIDDKNKEPLIKKIIWSILIRIEENSEHCCYIIGAYNKIFSSFKPTLLIVCIEFPTHYVCFLHIVFFKVS